VRDRHSLRSPSGDRHDPSPAALRTGPRRARAMRCRLGGSPAGHDFRDTPARLRLIVEHLHDTVPAVGGSKEDRCDLGQAGAMTAGPRPRVSDFWERFWERRSCARCGQTPSDAASGRHVNASDVRKGPRAGVLLALALSSGRRGRRFKSGHPDPGHRALAIMTSGLPAFRTAAKYSNGYGPSCFASRLSACSVLASETSV
jgi:hypothetical protein